MAVYVDGMRATVGRMVMCHCFADTPSELVAMMRKVGVDMKWIQDKGTYREHFDIALSKRKLAIEHGAIEISIKEVARLLNRKREAHGGR